MRAFWLTLFGGVLLYLSFVAGGAPDAGWFAYAPLTEPSHTVGNGMDWYIFGLAVSGAGTIIGAINLAVTILLGRCPGMVMGRAPMFTWMVLVTSVLILGAYPILTSALVMLLVDRQLGGRFFDPAAYRDTYRESVLKLIKRKAAGRRIDVAPSEEPAQADDDLTAALEASLSSAGR